MFAGALEADPAHWLPAWPGLPVLHLVDEHCNAYNLQGQLVNYSCPLCMPASQGLLYAFKLCMCCWQNLPSFWLVMPK